MSKTTATAADAGERVAIITGGNSGLGYESALALLNRGFRVILACRSMERGATARDKLRSQGGGFRPSAVSVSQLDTSSLKSVRDFASRVLAQGTPVHVLMCNAGIMMGPRRSSVDGYELQFATNYLGHFLLVETLLPLLSASGTPARPARIIHVSSVAGRFGRLQLDDIMHASGGDEGFDTLRVYQQSKYAQIVYSHSLAARLSASSSYVISHSLEPGIVATGLSKGINDPMMRSKLERGVSPAEGAQTQIALACLPAANVMPSSGMHWKDSAPWPAVTAQLSLGEANALYHLSAKLAGLNSSTAPPALITAAAFPGPKPGELREAARSGDADSVAMLASMCGSLAQLEDRDSADAATHPGNCAGGCTALVWAAARGHTSCVRALWEAYVRVVAGRGEGRETLAALRLALVDGNNVGENALMWAAALGHVECVKFLWEVCYTKAFDADDAREELQRTNRSFVALGQMRAGRTALQSAKARGHSEIVKLLSAAMAGN